MTAPLLLLLAIASHTIGHTAAQSTNQVVECTTPSGDYGSCILLESCPALVRLVTMNGEGSLDVLRKSTCGYIRAKPKVCCANNSNNIHFRDPDKTHSDVSQTERTTTVTGLPELATIAPSHHSQKFQPARPAQQTNFVPQQNNSVPQQNNFVTQQTTFVPHQTTFVAQQNEEQRAPNTESQHSTVPNAGSQHLTAPISPATLPQGGGKIERPSMGSLVIIPPGHSDTNIITYNGTDNALPRPDKCGNVNIANKIFGGDNTSVDDFPWMALLKYNTPELEQHYGCGGVLINNRYVLTAAHCIRTRNKYSLIEVRLGEWDLNTDVDCDDEAKECNTKPLDLGVEETIVHPQFDMRNLTNDIALVRLSQPVNYTDWVQPICLPDSRDVDYTDASFWVAGWGQTEHGAMSPVKLKLQVRHVPLEICAVAYRRLRIALGAGSMCAGGQLGRDTCAGDSGGPLMKLFTEGGLSNYRAVGIVSLGPSRCGVEGWAGVYTRVSHYVSWIRSSLRP